ncbi:DUF5565 family protein [Streptomyces lavendofoliae]|uniref:Mucin-1 n=1 Tax=Streptomyces lavendofoliae TaxID=67314 RepID=A0A918I3E4_9ACTN|nr:DUF5565 family protein [Streptomyces lavendofoliae]GGU62677.1 hypothetical protein GCM10010274_59360 [Streptomyces lavendofoliae]
MQKIPTLYIRDLTARPAHVTPTVTPGCEWVLAGEGTPTRKWDGTCTMLDHDGTWWARREVKPGKTPPPGFRPLSTDPATGKTVGWEPVAQSAFAKLHAEALRNSTASTPGTYELLGPKINGNPDRFDAHLLMPHGWAPLSVRQDLATVPRDYDALRAWLHARPYEGIVWHHRDGRRAKIKAADYPRQDQP